MQEDSTDGTIRFKVYNSAQVPIIHIRNGVHFNAECEEGPACKVSFPDKPVDVPNLYVIDTDYDTYSINYDCNGESGKTYLWIETREAEPD